MIIPGCVHPDFGRAYNQDQLQRISSSSFGEMLNGEPGVSMRSFGSAPARPVIRGLDGDGVLIVENGERMGDLEVPRFVSVITTDAPLRYSDGDPASATRPVIVNDWLAAGVINAGSRTVIVIMTVTDGNILRSVRISLMFNRMGYRFPRGL